MGQMGTEIWENELLSSVEGRGHLGEERGIEAENNPVIVKTTEGRSNRGPPVQRCDKQTLSQPERTL